MLLEKEKGQTVAPAGTKNKNYPPSKIIADREDFIKTFYKNLSGFFEVREIAAAGKAKSIYFEDLKELLNYRPPTNKNIYIGMFTRKRKKGRKEDIKQTQALWLDFDDKDSFYSFEYLVNINKLPEPTAVINSGHGYHVYYKLEKPAGREIEPVLKELARKTAADTRAAELARIMRLPATMNVKYPEKPVKCEVKKIIDKTYKLKSIADLLGVKAKAMEKATDKAELVAETLGIDYKGIKSQVNLPCIKSIFEGVGEGQRNWALGRVTMYLRNILGFSQRKSFKVVRVWNLKCDPAQRESDLKSSFKSYWRSDYNLLGCQIPDKPDLQQFLNNHCNKNACIRMTGRIKNNKSIVKDNSTDSFYNNRIIKRIDKLHGTALIIYAVLEKHEEGLTADRATEIIDISIDYFRKRAKELKNAGFIEIKKGNRRKGIKNLYKVNRQGTYGTGRTSISYGAVIAAANNIISPAQYKVYLLLKWFEQIGQTKGVYPSTFTLADRLRLDQSTVQNHITALYKKDFIEVDKTDEGYNIYKLQI